MGRSVEYHADRAALASKPSTPDARAPRTLYLTCRPYGAGQGDHHHDHPRPRPDSAQWFEMHGRKASL